VLVTTHAWDRRRPSWPGSWSPQFSAWRSAHSAIRRHGIYFAMITLALAQLVYFVCLEAPFTGGENGLQVCHGGACSACCR